MSSSGTEATAAIAPKPPTPLYPDVPWWAVLVTAFVFAVVGVLAGVYGAMPALPGGETTAGVGSVIVDTVSYIPHILLLFGILADMFTLDGAWSIPSIVGILSIFMNYVFQYFWKGIEELGITAKKAVEKGSAEAPAEGVRKVKGGRKVFEDYKGCAVQGFSGLQSAYAPQTLVVTATVFAYYCFDLIANRGWVNSIAAIVGFILAYVGQVVVIDLQNPVVTVGETSTGGCDEKGTSAFVGGLRALFEGFLFGGVGYGIVQTYAPTRLPSSTISPFPRKTASDLSPGPDGRMYDADGYPYLVLPNGQAVPDVSDAKSRAAFGQMAGAAAGETVALSTSCPGVTAGCDAV